LAGYEGYVKGAKGIKSEKVNGIVELKIEAITNFEKSLLIATRGLKNLSFSLL